MHILAHRGAWKKVDEKNSFAAIERAFLNGWGIETDIRDYNGRLVVSHDMPAWDSILFEEVLRIYKSAGKGQFLAINIKADGLQKHLIEMVSRFDVSNYAVFDMSIPEQIVYRKMKIPFLSRQSEIEMSPVMYESAVGVWMDEWEESWIHKEQIEAHIRNDKIIGIISPELHGRNYKALWQEIKHINSDKIYLCTDDPWNAEEVFNGTKN